MEAGSSKLALGAEEGQFEACDNNKKKSSSSSRMEQVTICITSYAIQ